jgi:hypothetical protein
MPRGIPDTRSIVGAPRPTYRWGLVVKRDNGLWCVLYWFKTRNGLEHYAEKKGYGPNDYGTCRWNGG